MGRFTGVTISVGSGGGGGNLESKQDVEICLRHLPKGIICNWHVQLHGYCFIILTNKI